MRVGILGSGLMGGKLGMIFARAGHEVIFTRKWLPALDTLRNFFYAPTKMKIAFELLRQGSPSG